MYPIPSCTNLFVTGLALSFAVGVGGISKIELEQCLQLGACHVVIRYVVHGRPLYSLMKVSSSQLLHGTCKDGRTRCGRLVTLINRRGRRTTESRASWARTGSHLVLFPELTSTSTCRHTPSTPASCGSKPVTSPALSFLRTPMFTPLRILGVPAVYICS